MGLLINISDSYPRNDTVVLMAVWTRIQHDQSSWSGNRPHNSLRRLKAHCCVSQRKILQGVHIL